MSLAILFFLLAAKSAILAYYPSTDAEMIKLFTQVIGVEGIICGLSSFYLAMAEVLNEAHGKTILPICPVGQ